MDRSEKERVVAELAERLRVSDTLIVADYRGLATKDLDALRRTLAEHGARFAVVKNTLTRRAAEAAGADALLGLLEGPSALAFLEADGDPVAVAKALGDAARTTRVLAIRGGVLEGRALSAEDVEELAKLPPVDVVRGQVLGAITAPLTTVVGLFSAPLRDLVGLIDARIEQLEAGGGSPEAEGTAEADAQAAPEEAAPAAAEAEAAPAPEDAADTTSAGDEAPAQPQAEDETNANQEES
jgi:large subunit ribosomal protein L10